MLVVFHHARNSQPWLYDALSSFTVGQFGVDIFFVISGYIMYSSSRHEGIIEFARRRIVRVLPMYWLATLLLLGLHLRKDGIDLELARHVVGSLLFIPHYSVEHPGQIWPYLIPGWTLNYEIFFYIIFAVGLLTRKLLPTVALIIFCLIALGITSNSKNALIRTYTDTLMLEFLSGMILARYHTIILRPACLTLFPLGAVALYIGSLYNAPRILCWGLPAFMFVAGALTLERLDLLPRSRFLVRLGDASYSIYLFQWVGLFAASKIVVRLPISGVEQLAAMILVSCVSAIIVGWIMHLVVEKPLLRLLTRKRLSIQVDLLAEK
jgi:exopolysaccharide production protein ExoZ